MAKDKKKRIVSKILKMDENNQYGNAMTKLLPYGCIKKEKEIPDLQKFILILQDLSPGNKIGHLFVVDIVFDKNNVDEKKLLFNEIYTPLFEKKMLIKPLERSVLQLQSIMSKHDTGALKTFKCNEKTKSTMKKGFSPLYAEHFHFLVTKASWLVTKMHTHYTFEQSKFKKDFVEMNQVSRQKAKAKIEKDFYKLMNNSNFGYDCRNNIDNCKFKPMFDDVEEIANIQKYSSLFDDVCKDCFYPDLIATQIENEYNNELMKIDQNDPFADAKRYDVGEKRKRKMDALDSHKSKIKRKKIVKDNDKKQRIF